MRNYKTLIAEAELMAMAPEAVASFLKSRAAKGEHSFNDPVDKETEAALRGRNDPLINLALAQYARFGGTLRPLFGSAEPGSAIRLAALSNRALEFGLFSPIGVGLFADTQRAVAWLGSAPYEEIAALFENPKLHDDFLRGLLKRENPWDQVPDERLCSFVSFLAYNERMFTPYNRAWMDGFAEYSHGSVFDAAWSLAERVEPRQQWAAALSWLFDRMPTKAFSIKDPLALATRWNPDSSDAKLTQIEGEEFERGYLSDYQGVRKGLARLALSKDSKLLGKLLASDDPGLRSAAYAEGKLTPEQLSEAYDKDGELLFNQAVHNVWIWQTAAGREALSGIAWTVAREDKNSDLLAPNTYNSVREAMATKHPDWFKDKEENTPPESDVGDIPTNKTDLAALAGGLEQALQAIRSRVLWVWWFALGALVVSVINLWR